jgi:protease I
MAEKPVLLVVANEGYQQVEYNETKKAIESAGLKVVTASNAATPAIAKDGSTTDIDVVLDKVNPAHYAGIFVIGGPGALENLDNPQTHKILQKAVELGIPHGAICVSPRILAKAGVLKNKKATGWNDDKALASIYEESDTIYVKEPVVVDHLLITATGPDAAKQFGTHIAQLIKKHSA